MGKSARSPVALARRTFEEWTNDGAPKLGASLAFYSMLSIGPLLLIAVAVTGLFVSHDQAGRYLIEQIKGLVGADGAQTLETVIRHSRDQHKGVLASIIGVVTLLISAAGFFGQLQEALNIIFDVPKAKATFGQFIKKRLLSFGMVVGICLLLLSSLVISAVLAGLTGALGDSVPLLAGQVLNVVLSVVISTVLFALAFKVLPDVELQWRDVWIGAVITAVLFAVGKSLIGLYLGHSSFSSTYGAAGSLIVLLVWVYYSAQIIFFGAEFTQVYAEASGKTFKLKKGMVAPKEPAKAEKPDAGPAAASEARPGVMTAALSLIALAGITSVLWPARPSRR